jgi:pyruvate,orthophosphate dikinase
MRQLWPGVRENPVVGASEVPYYARNEFVVNARVRRGEWITVDGTSGQVILGQAPLIDRELGEDFHQLMEWADNARKLRVRANADTPADAAMARKFGAEGIGLCRTEHMFFAGDRIDSVREMILGSLEYKRLERELKVVEAELSRGFRRKGGRDLERRKLRNRLKGDFTGRA